MFPRSAPLYIILYLVPVKTPHGFLLYHFKLILAGLIVPQLLIQFTFTIQDYIAKMRVSTTSLIIAFRTILAVQAAPALASAESIAVVARSVGSWTYDAEGNEISESENFEYDANGNETLDADFEKRDPEKKAKKAANKARSIDSFSCDAAGIEIEGIGSFESDAEGNDIEKRRL
jgi:hypothetical protein